MDRRLTRQGRKRKAQLLRHAAELFAERGYAETRVIDIVRAAGVAKGLFYWYFDNKEAVFRDLVHDTRRRLRQVQGEALQGVDGPLRQIHVGTTASVRFMADHRHLYALMQIEGQTGSTFTDDLRTTTSVHAADTAALIEAGQRLDEIRRDDDALTLAYGVLGTVMHMVFFHRTGRLDLPPDDLASAVARFVTRGLAASDVQAIEAEATAQPSVPMPARA
jgi:AcrR family transcriptional regulator